MTKDKGAGSLIERPIYDPPPLHAINKLFQEPMYYPCLVSDTQLQLPLHSVTALARLYLNCALGFSKKLTSYRLNWGTWNRDWTKCLLLCSLLYRQGHRCLNCTHSWEGFVYKWQVCIIWSMCPCSGNDTESGELELVQLAVHSPDDANSEGLYNYTLNFMLDPLWKGVCTCEIFIYQSTYSNDPRSILVYVVWQHYEARLLFQLYLQWAQGLNYSTFHEYWEPTSILFRI